MSDLNSSADPEIEDENDAKPDNSTTDSPLSKLSQILRKRTLDLIAIGIVIAATLTLGRQMAAWWNTDPNAVHQFSESARLLAGSERMWTEADQPVSVEFGGVPYHMQREKVIGNETQVVERLSNRALQHSRTNAPLEQTHSSYARLLKAIQKEEPEKSEKNVDVFVLRGPAPIVVGTKRPIDTDTKGREVVCWGLYYPSEQNEWTTWLFSRSSEGGDANDKQQPLGKLEEILPSGSKTVMALSTTQGGTILNFRSETSLRECQGQLDENLEKLGWKSLQGWNHHHNSVLNSYEFVGGSGKTTSESTGQTHQMIGRIDLQLTETDGNVSGVVYRLSKLSERTRSQLKNENSSSE